MKVKDGSQNQDEQLEALVTAVTASTKYAHISPVLIRQVGGRELANRRNLKTAVKATKNKLHQVGGAYLESRMDYAGMLNRLHETAVSPDAFRQTCRDMMALHTSTRERLLILDTFYKITLAHLSDIHVVVDVACGLNPLARAWMPFDDTIEYIAYDIYADMIGFVGQFMQMAGVNGRAQVRDLISQPPTEPADLILILKTLPVLEQLEKGSASRLLDTLNARYMLISFPVHSLSGRGKGMLQNYEAQFHTWMAGRDWQLQRFEFASELAFLIKTR